MIKLMIRLGKLLPLLVLLLLPMNAFAVIPGVEALRMIENEDGSQSYSVTIQILAIMTSLTFLPAMLVMMTSFTRIIVVLAILRQAMGLQQTPSNQIVLGLSLFLTFFIMTPVWERVNAEALQPYIAEEVGPLEAVNLARAPLQEFMLSQTREVDLDMFARIGGYNVIASPEEVPFVVLVPAFVTSELKTAFQIGFMLFIPFLILDMVVASILMAMGMMMLSPVIISLPFKIMLFVLVDGWTLVMGTLAASYGY